MTKRGPDPIAIHHEVMQSVTDRLTKAQTQAEERLVTAPAVGEKMTPDEERMQYLRFLTDPMFREFFVNDAASREKLTNEYPIPKQLFLDLVDAHQRFGLKDDERPGLEERAPNADTMMPRLSLATMPPTGAPQTFSTNGGSYG